MLTAGFRWAPETLPMKRMIPSTIKPGATTAAVRVIVFGNASLIIPPPPATITSRNVPYSSENSRRHSWSGSWKSCIGPMTSRLIQPATVASVPCNDSLTRNSFRDAVAEPDLSRKRVVFLPVNDPRRRAFGGRSRAAGAGGGLFVP